MKDLRYIEGVSTLKLDPDLCTGCGTCMQVCPHGVFIRESKKVEIDDFDGCMECGACALNCPEKAVTVNPGVGCASYIIKTWTKGKGKAACDDIACC